MHIRKRATDYSVEIKKNCHRFYKGGFKTKKAAKEWGSKK